MIDCEEKRQKETINLIASENYVSQDVLAALANVFTNKYAEGVPGKRYYQGCENVDLVEQYAINKLKKIFHAEAANVQPHSGTQANQAVYLALLSPNDTVLAMSLSSGGHLSHGHHANLSGKMYNFVHYNVDKITQRLNYREILKLAKIHRPKLIVAGASSYSRAIDFKQFRRICDSVGAILMVDMAHIAGLVAAGYHMSPIPFADIVTSTTHKTLRGPRGGFILCRERYIEKINKAVFPGIQGGPLENIIFAKAVGFDECTTQSFNKYISHVLINASEMCAVFKNNRIDIISGSTDNHQFTINVRRSFAINGKEAADLLAEYGIYVNQNTIPFDPEKPYLASGIRIGTSAITSLCALPGDVRRVAKLIINILSAGKYSLKNEDWIKERRSIIVNINKNDRF